MASSSTAASALTGTRAGAAWLRVVCALVGLAFAAPFLYLASRGVSESSSLWSLWTSADALRPLLNSVLLATTVAGGATVIGVAAAWLVARTDLPGVRVWRILLPLPLVIPSFIGAFVLIAAFARGGLLERVFGIEGLGSMRGFPASFVVLTLFTYPYVYLPAAARLRQLPPSLEESARLLGRRPLSAFFTVVVPQARAAVLAGTLLVFLYSISEFGVVQMLRYDTLTRVIYATRLFDRARSLSLSLLLGVLALIVVAIERGAAWRAPRAAARRSERPALVVALGGWRWAGIGFLIALVGLALGVPVGVLLWWSVRGWDQIAAVADLAAPILNTASASISAALVAVVVVLPVAYLTVRHRSRVGDAANAVVVAGFALPGLAIALALVVVTLTTPGPLGVFYQTFPLLVFAYVVHFGAQALRGTQAAMAGVPPRLEDAARVLGANRWQRLMRVELPLMAPGLFAAAGLVLMSSMKELPATLLLAPPGFQTLSMKVWQATESALFAQAGLTSLVLIVLSGALTWALVIRREGSAV